MQKKKSPCSQRERTPKQKKILAVKAEHPELSQSQVAAIVGCERSMVSRTWTQYGVDQKELDRYKSSRADLFDTLAYRIMRSITEDDIKQASLMQRLSGLGIVYDKMRVERGLGDSAIRPMIHVHISTTPGGEARVDNAIDIDPPMKTITYDKE